jgi:hypothetical protein
MYKGQLMRVFALFNKRKVKREVGLFVQRVKKVSRSSGC